MRDHVATERKNRRNSFYKERFVTISKNHSDFQTLIVADCLELLLMAKSRECRQRSRSVYTAKTSIVEDVPSRDNIHLEGTVSLPNTSWRNRNNPRNMWMDDPLHVSTQNENVRFLFLILFLRI